VTGMYSVQDNRKGL